MHVVLHKYWLVPNCQAEIIIIIYKYFQGIRHSVGTGAGPPDPFGDTRYFTFDGIMSNDRVSFTPLWECPLLWFRSEYGTTYRFMA